MRNIAAGFRSNVQTVERKHVCGPFCPLWLHLIIRSFTTIRRSTDVASAGTARRPNRSKSAKGGASASQVPSTPAPPAGPKFAGIFTQQLWKSVGLEPKHVLCPRDFYFPDVSAGPIKKELPISIEDVDPTSRRTARAQLPKYSRGPAPALARPAFGFPGPLAADSVAPKVIRARVPAAVAAAEDDDYHPSTSARHTADTASAVAVDWRLPRRKAGSQATSTPPEFPCIFTTWRQANASASLKRKRGERRPCSNPQLPLVVLAALAAPPAAPAQPAMAISPPAAAAPVPHGSQPHLSIGCQQTITAQQLLQFLQQQQQQQQQLLAAQQAAQQRCALAAAAASLQPLQPAAAVKLQAPSELNLQDSSVVLQPFSAQPTADVALASTEGEAAAAAMECDAPPAEKPEAAEAPPGSAAPRPMDLDTGAAASLDPSAAPDATPAAACPMDETPDPVTCHATEAAPPAPSQPHPSPVSGSNAEALPPERHPPVPTQLLDPAPTPPATAARQHSHDVPGPLPQGSRPAHVPSAEEPSSDQPSTSTTLVDCCSEGGGAQEEEGDTRHRSATRAGSPSDEAASGPAAARSPSAEAPAADQVACEHPRQPGAERGALDAANGCGEGEAGGLRLTFDDSAETSPLSSSGLPLLQQPDEGQRGQQRQQKEASPADSNGRSGSSADGPQDTCPAAAKLPNGSGFDPLLTRDPPVGGCALGLEVAKAPCAADKPSPEAEATPVHL